MPPSRPSVPGLLMTVLAMIRLSCRVQAVRHKVQIHQVVSQYEISSLSR